ncbi:hypothetical protein B0H10DRAFT_2229580 [Mycena sp. CBHHK59/15]|nr:hypothetical protein B0H10DRAFT_2229580 [Mycena sp. CBHHK59/15]
MAVDDDPAAKLRFKKKAKDTSNTSQVTSETPKESSSKLHKSGSSKRARTDSTPFNEEAFLTAAVAEFCSTASFNGQSIFSGRQDSREGI